MKLDNGHALLSPSGSGRWIPCAPSVHISARFPGRSGEAAMEGTAAHWLLELILRENTRVADYIGRAVEVIEDGRTVRLEVNQAAAADLDLAGDYIREVAAISGEARIEALVDLGFLEPDMFGRVDLSHFSHDGVLTIADLKYGRIDVDVWTKLPPSYGIRCNTQLLIYALGELRRLSAQGAQVKWVRLAIIQPRSLVPGPKIKQVVIPVDEVWHFEKVLARAIGETNNPNAKFAMGEWCKYCPALGICPASIDTAQVVGSLLSVDWNEATGEQVAALLDRKDFVLQIIKKAEAKAMNLLFAEEKVADYGLYTSNKHRVWADEEKAKEELFAQFGLKGLTPVSPRGAEQLGKEGGRISSIHAFKPPGDPTVGKKGDKRAPYIARSASEIFGNLLDNQA